jgi:actin-related protein 6
MQLGIPEAILKSISALPEDIRDIFWANIGVIGGNCQLRGFTKRLYVSIFSALCSRN